MDASPPPYLLEAFLSAADRAARERPDVDRDVARELMGEAAMVLHNGLVLDDLDPHDLEVAVSALAADLVAPDPGAAVRARAEGIARDPADLHDPAAVRAACLVTLSVLGL